ncbi:MAG: adenylyl-sulfate reductase subunit alpha [Selenomonadaceae bacterium]|nr:adenylyl-sulfate reductase subunit alpha [Selenomonadaceae bacterium]MBP3721646.1 adenylyl-sulfate reductase subunit alpha [Selenomonadaceae bacterium]
MQTAEFTADILVIGGGAAGCFAAITLAEKYSNLSAILVDKANIKRSGCLAAGVNALNAYIVKGETPINYALYAENDAAGIARGDLLLSMSEKLNSVTAKAEKLGLVIQKNPDGSYAARGKRNIKINGENIKPLLAAGVHQAKNIQVLNHVNIVDYIKDNGKIIGAWGIDIVREEIVFITAKAVICATGGAAGLYRPNHTGFSRHKIWYSPFNTGAGYAMGLRAGAEMTSFEMRFIALRCKDTIAPTGTLAQGIGATQINVFGEEYQAAYGNTTSERVFAVVSENLAGRGPCYLKTTGITKEEEESLEKAYLNMAPAQTMRWLETGLTPSKSNVEVEGSEPYIVGGHTASGYWVDINRKTTLEGLFAAGDVAGGCPQKYVTGAFAEGEIAAKSAASFALYQTSVNLPEDVKKSVVKQIENFMENKNSENSLYDENSLEEAMQSAMDEYAGGIKTYYRYNETGLREAKAHIERIEKLSENLRAHDFYELMKIFELKERLLLCQVLIAHLQARKETRWHCFAENLDYPEKKAEFDKYINSVLENGKPKIILRPLISVKDAGGERV